MSAHSGPALASRIVTAFAAVFAMTVPSHAASEVMRVYMDQARVLKLDRAVSKVIVGNAEVADATVADARTIVLTGKSFGSTNLVILDSEGRALVDKRVIVSIDEGDTVRVYRQTERTVLSCAPICEAQNAAKAAGVGN